MSHLHFCDVTGHGWECEGTALRPLAGDTEPSVCMCRSCQVPMEEGDHSRCMIELLACQLHMDEQLRAMREIRGDNADHVLVCPADNVCLGCGLPMNTHDYEQCMNLSRPRKSQGRAEINEANPISRTTAIQHEPPSPAPHCECGCADADTEKVIDWCMWCDHVYVDHNRVTEDQHFARHCPDAPQELKHSARARLARESR